MLVQGTIYIVGFGLVEMAISTNPKPTIYRNLYENTDTESTDMTEQWAVQIHITELLFCAVHMCGNSV